MRELNMKEPNQNIINLNFKAVRQGMMNEA